MKPVSPKVWRKSREGRIDHLLYLFLKTHNELRFCSECWAVVWEPHRQAHREWHRQQEVAP